jgi:predicted transcriptional regulator
MGGKMEGKFPVSISLDRASLEKLDALAEADGRTRSEMVRWLLRNMPWSFRGTVVRRSINEVPDSIVGDAK